MKQPDGRGPGEERPAIDDERLRPMKHGDVGVFRPPTGGAGDIVVRADVAGTAVFAVTAVVAAVAFTPGWQWTAAVVVLGLFVVGVFAFLWSYYNAVQRSRTEELSVLQLYLLLGPPTPARVRRVMVGALAAQVVVGVATALVRPEGPDGNPGSSLALGVLVPMFGLGLNGLWAAYHGAFPPRSLKPTSGARGAHPPV